MQRVNPTSNQAEENAVAAAARAGDEPAFTELAVRYRAELQVHCYRMLGSLEDSEALVRETFVRAWRRRETYQTRSSFRAWLYRISTNACLDFLARRPHDGQIAAAGAAGDAPPAMIPWLQPYPDRLLDAAASSADDAATAKETIELAYLAAVQHLPSRQRAVLILRDVLGWPAKDAAAALETTVASVNSSLQRARPTLRRHLPERREERAAPEAQSERAALERYMAAIERTDDAALTRLLSEDARAGRQPGAGGHDGPDPVLVEGRTAIVAAWTPALHDPGAVAFRFMATRANRQPAAAAYARGAGESAFQPFGLSVLRLEDGTVTDISTFPPDLFPAFGLPALL